MPADEAVKANLTKVIPTIVVGDARQALSERSMAKLERVVVDHQLNLPDMFEITFFEMASGIEDMAKLAIGATVTVSSRAPGNTARKDLIVGEITSIEGVFAGTCHTVVRGYSADHRLQRARKSRTFVNMKRSDIARKVAGDAGLTVGEITETKTAHDHIGQVNQTDWEFLTEQASAVGYELGVVDGKFVFRKPASTAKSGSGPVLTYPDNLQSFQPRISAANIAEEAEVRVWDPLATKVTAAKVPVAAVSVEVDGHSAGSVAGAFGSAAPAKPPPSNGSAGKYGPAPSDKGHVISDWPLAAGSAARSAADEAVDGTAGRLGDTFAEAEGESIGDPGLRAGTAVEIAGVTKVFSGKWVITRSRHLFDRRGYHTHFEVSGRQSRSLLALASGGNNRRQAARLNGLVCGVVTNNNDPAKKGRVKLAFPWLSSAYESDWAPVVQAGAGELSGTMFLPEVGDEVLAGFEFGDPQRAYVVGGVVNNASKYELGGEPIKAKGEAGSVVWRGFVSSSGNRLAFHDELPPGGGAQPPVASDLVLGTKDGSLALAIDQTAGTVTLSCQPAKPASKAVAGAISIECGEAGSIDIATGSGGKVTIDGGSQLNLTAQTGIKIESKGIVEIKGSQIKLN